MPFRVVSPPPVEPVTTEQAIQWCRASDQEASLIDVLIQAARERAEHETQRVFVQRTLEWTGRAFGEYVEAVRFPCEHYLAKLTEPRYGAGLAIQLAAPVQSITSVKYLDQAGVEQTVASGAYALDTSSEPAVLRYLSTYAQPVVKDATDAVRVRFVAGYPTDLTDPDEPDYRKNLPAALVQWMQVTIATWYAQRENLTPATVSAAPRTFADSLLDGLILATRFA